MYSVATLTMNPTIDVSYEVASVRHTHKMRTQAEAYAPGGGGINVARVIVRLGGHARCFYLSGGATGPALDGLIDLHQLVRTRIAIAEPTRIATAVLARDNEKEFRFTPQGPTVSEPEWRECLERLSQTDCTTMVMSGSLPPGVPTDFYSRVVELLAPRGVRMVLDSSGEALTRAVSDGGFHLVKPSLSEIQTYAGRELATIEEIGAVAMEVIDKGKAELIAVTLGHQGALLARKEGTLYLPAIDVEVKSAVGAGDSFLAGMVHALGIGHDPVDAFRFGIAAGSAALITPGTGLALAADIHRLFGEMAAV